MSESLPPQVPSAEHEEETHAGEHVIRVATGRMLVGERKNDHRDGERRDKYDEPRSDRDAVIASRPLTSRPGPRDAASENERSRNRMVHSLKHPLHCLYDSALREYHVDSGGSSIRSKAGISGAPGHDVPAYIELELQGSRGHADTMQRGYPVCQIPQRFRRSATRRDTSRRSGSALFIARALRSCSRHSRRYGLLKQRLNLRDVRLVKPTKNSNHADTESDHGGR